MYRVLLFLSLSFFCPQLWAQTGQWTCIDTNDLNLPTTMTMREIAPPKASNLAEFLITNEHEEEIGRVKVDQALTIFLTKVSGEQWKFKLYSSVNGYRVYTASLDCNPDRQGGIMGEVVSVIFQGQIRVSTYKAYTKEITGWNESSMRNATDVLSYDLVGETLNGAGLIKKSAPGLEQNRWKINIEQSIIERDASLLPLASILIASNLSAQNNLAHPGQIDLE